MRILLLGATGMVGRSLLRKLESDSKLKVVGTTTRKPNQHNLTRFCWPNDPLDELIKKTSPNIIINLAAKLDSKSLNNNLMARQDAFSLNSDLPSGLSIFADRLKVIHMSTDGVFSGINPPYYEKSVTDGEGVYADSKILGEAGLKNGKILRCSIIGRSPNPLVSIPNLLLRQPKNAVIPIAENEKWNGVTSDAFAEFTYSLISNNFLDAMNHVQHITPRFPITKKDLFKEIAKSLGRDDLVFGSIQSERPRSRILATENSAFLTEVWEKTSFGFVPSIQDMIRATDFKGAL